VLAALAWRVSRDRLAVVISALLITLSPCAAFVTFQIWDSALTGLLFTLFLYFALLLLSAPSISLTLLLGVTAGVLFLTNAGVATIFIPITFILLAIRVPWKFSLFAAAIFLLISTPWLVRNYLLFGKPEPRCCPGFELKMGNNEAIWNAGSTAYLPSQTILGSPGELEKYSTMGEAAYDAGSLRDALAFIRSDYWRFGYMTARRIRDFWFGTFNWTSGIGAGRGLSPFLIDQLYFSALSSVPIFSFLGAFGLVRAIAHRYSITLFVVFLLVYPPVIYLNSVNLRLQYPAQLVLIVLSGFALSGAYNWWRGRSRQVSPLP
jgi:4-amino-4-deoxy-L-arabinose transferase-like glycosyltransferase